MSYSYGKATQSYGILAVILGDFECPLAAELCGIQVVADALDRCKSLLVTREVSTMVGRMQAIGRHCHPWGVFLHTPPVYVFPPTS